MIAKQFVILSAFVLTSSLCAHILPGYAKSFVRIAELEIDPALVEKLGRPIGKQDI